MILNVAPLFDSRSSKTKLPPQITHFRCAAGHGHDERIPEAADRR